MHIVYFVIPCYNEEKVIDETTRRLTEKLDQMVADQLISADSRILYVDDGSSDCTWEKITEYNLENPYVCGLKLSRNRGHQNALFAGLMTAKAHCECVISLDADLQDDIDALDQFIQAFDRGNDIVYGVRKNRNRDTFFKRTSAQLFYKFMRFMGADMVYNHADYRLMSVRSLEALSEYGETNLFLRGIIPLIGFQSTTVFYDRAKRFAGESKYPLKKMLAFALDGITSFSVRPIRLIFGIGVVVFLFSIIVLIYALVRKISGATEIGWATLMGSIWLLGGVQLLCIGICGEYIGKMYQEVKSRPKYIIECFLKK